MGTFYRSKHKLIFVVKHGTGEHIDSFGLGDTGRYRTNVWDYTGRSSISADRGDELAMHPTVRPVTLVSDIIHGCSKPGHIILDCFGGSGSTQLVDLAFLFAAGARGRS
ncbi:DNA methyltransferase [Sphingorhabdus sp. 109]|uniref:DNA methyltransferase n=1 Tax=Sphingorhabdus sp. 109 TaxID=2653173 RepID=UPI0012F440D0